MFELNQIPIAWQEFMPVCTHDLGVEIIDWSSAKLKPFWLVNQADTFNGSNFLLIHSKEKNRWFLITAPTIADLFSEIGCKLTNKQTAIIKNRFTEPQMFDIAVIGFVSPGKRLLDCGAGIGSVLTYDQLPPSIYSDENKTIWGFRDSVMAIRHGDFDSARLSLVKSRKFSDKPTPEMRYLVQCPKSLWGAYFPGEMIDSKIAGMKYRQEREGNFII